MKEYSGAAITIGVFDGVHIGHQFLIKKVLKIAKEKNLESIVINFDVSESCVNLNKPQPCNSILSQKEKVSKIQKLGVDRVVTIELSPEFMSQTAEEFLEYLLIVQKMKVLVVGEDFAFGKDRIGNTDWLTQKTKDSNFELIIVPKFKAGGQIVSSSFLRGLGDAERKQFL
jgi:riboflavin kinase / FMN adenylyltransferase